MKTVSTRLCLLPRLHFQAGNRFCSCWGIGAPSGRDRNEATSLLNNDGRRGLRHSFICKLVCVALLLPID